MAVDSLNSLLSKLSQLTPPMRNGWFRWMHHGFAGRQWRVGDDTFSVEPETVELWRKIAYRIYGEEPSIGPHSQLIVTLAETHAHSLGRASPRLMAEVWAHISPPARGRAFAAATYHLNDRFKEQLLPRIESLRDSKFEINFDPEAATETTCNLIAADLLEEFPYPFDSICDWGQASIERLDPMGRKEDVSTDSLMDWDRFMVPLSPLAVDRCLEAAVRMENHIAAERCLEAGADPNIAIWDLERSFNEKFSALSYSLCSPPRRDPDFAVANLLLDEGAEATGTEYEGLNKPLFQALRIEEWKFADHLLDKGASFTGGSPCFHSLSKSQKELRWLYFDYELSRNKLDWIQKIFGEVLSLCEIGDQPCFHVPNPQGGNHYSFLSTLLRPDRIEQLEHFVERGLPLAPTAVDILRSIQSCTRSSDDSFLVHLFDRLEANPVAIEMVTQFRQVFDD